MIIDNFDIVGVTVNEAKAKTPLFIDSDAVRASAITTERFKTITGRYAQEVKRRGSVQLGKLALSDPLHVYETTYTEAVSEPFCVLTPVTPNHFPIFSAIGP